MLIENIKADLLEAVKMPWQSYSGEIFQTSEAEISEALKFVEIIIPFLKNTVTCKVMTSCEAEICFFFHIKKNRKLSVISFFLSRKTLTWEFTEKN